LGGGGGARGYNMVIGKICNYSIVSIMASCIFKKLMKNLYFESIESCINN
jgi:hypothetical protein